MTMEDINRVQLLEKTKDMLVCKLDKMGQIGSIEEMQKKIEELTGYIGRVEEQIESIM